ncbi:NUDIX domain-containing protein [Microbacterium aoyamense]|uniref:NUDIX domain-containing protein n=1 Tax=Microbacterium aoyamense TaxID=344166 RepID=A0ABN2PUH5_9MICO|nr:NUDIX domain-containing protein [Microbacterium aoyamense]
MPTPDYVLSMRSCIGHAPLFLAGVTAIVVRDGRILLGRRSDNGALTPPTGIVDPGEEPADAAVRETLEETGVRVRAERLAWVHQIPRVTYPNGDECDYLGLVFRCEWIEGDPHPADGELTDVGWYDLDGLPELELADMRRRIDLALGADLPTRFEGGTAPA